MPRIHALSILLQDEGKEYLSELYGKVIAGVMKALISSRMKNTDLSGDPTSGSVEAKRFVNATPQKYGTARAAGAGNKVKAKPVNVVIDTDREIVEEIENKDIKLYGVDGLLDRRSANHVIRMASALDKDFFAEAYNNAVAVEISGTATIEDELETVIQECENTINDFVDGVPREMMYLVLNTAYYGKVRNHLDTRERANVDTGVEKFNVWHGVECDSCVHLPAGCRYILMVKGAVAQPVMSSQYDAEKIGLSEAYAVELFYHYGTATVTPDLIFTGVAAGLANLTVDTTVADPSTSLYGKTLAALQEDIVIGVDEITGILHHVADYSSAWGSGEDSGNYLALHATCSGADSITCELVGGVHGPVTLESDGVVVFRITDPDIQAVRFTAYKGTEARSRTFALNNLTLETA